ncbi:hypothetical protein ALC62_14217 [Cyphomyrmex costatus]|uniref:THAP-type domain-containing protein n=1 Tax=Cyphomyrmex costatus TaxID=456900 RepID=A0A151I909_9HYME|nr:hypothetical protein ALC62_14217 [Cyphomyrmex costatus]
MTGCVAENCTNSSKKGVKMCFFPSDPVRRAVWVANVRRQNWLPNKYSALCEVCNLC